MKQTTTKDNEMLRVDAAHKGKPKGSVAMMFIPNSDDQQEAIAAFKALGYTRRIVVHTLSEAPSERDLTGYYTHQYKNRQLQQTWS